MVPDARRGAGPYRLRGQEVTTMRDVSYNVMGLVLDHVGVSTELADIWNDNVDDGTINMEIVAETIEHFHNELKDELIDIVESMSAEGQARTFGMWFDERECQDVRKMLMREGRNHDEVKELLEDYDDEDLVGYVVVLYGDIHCVALDERAGATDIVEDAIDGEQWETLAKLLVTL